MSIKIYVDHWVIYDNKKLEEAQIYSASGMTKIGASMKWMCLELHV